RLRILIDQFKDAPAALLDLPLEGCHRRRLVRACALGKISALAGCDRAQWYQFSDRIYDQNLKSQRPAGAAFRRKNLAATHTHLAGRLRN
ncbi:MAG: hypothetical protein DMF02_00310, partial [Verrucomicrobia bacterium]